MLNPRVRLSQNPATGAPAHEMKIDSNVPLLKPPPALAALHPLSSAQPSQALPASVALQLGVGDAVAFHWRSRISVSLWGRKRAD